MLAYRRCWPLAAVPDADDPAEAVLGLPCGRSGQIGAQVRRHVVHDPLEAKPLKGATEPIRQLAIGVKIERLAGNRGALHDLAFNGEHGAAAGDLFLAFAQPVNAAMVRGDARQHVAESTRDLEPRVPVNEQLSAIGHLAALFRRARDHLAGELPAPNCAHDKLALSCPFASPSKPTRQPFKQQQIDRSAVRSNVVALARSCQLETQGFVVRSPRAKKKRLRGQRWGGREPSSDLTTKQPPYGAR